MAVGPEAQGQVAIDGTARGPVLRLGQPLSFWGGVDPLSGRLTDPRGEAPGQSIAGTILMLPATRGSSSGSAVLLELIARGQAPAGIVLGRLDAILGLGIIVARELGYPTLPLLVLAADAQAAFPSGSAAVIEPGGVIRLG